MNGQRCSVCSITPNEQAREDFLQLVKTNGHILLTNYINGKTKVLIDYKCGHKPHLITPDNYKKGVLCPICNKNYAPIAKENFENLVKERNHKIVKGYINSKTKVVIDFGCGHKPYEIYPDNYKKIKMCPICKGRNTIASKLDLYNIVEKNNHKLLSEYIKNEIKVLIDFNCGHEPHWIKPNHYKQGHGCPKCARNCSKHAEQELIESVEKNGYKLLSKYIKSTIPVLIDFNCGHGPQKIKPIDYKIGVRCTSCSDSRGEVIIREYLTEINVNWHKKYRIITDDTNMSRKIYDIYIPQYNLIVEVHGIQHYEDVMFFSNRTLKEEQDNDLAKENYAKENNYNYMIVDYRETIPELALERFKKKFSDFIGEYNGKNK